MFLRVTGSAETCGAPRVISVCTRPAPWYTLPPYSGLGPPPRTMRAIHPAAELATTAARAAGGSGAGTGPAAGSGGCAPLDASIISSSQRSTRPGGSGTSKPVASLACVPPPPPPSMNVASA
jgi:hypothetical protein